MIFGHHLLAWAEMFSRDSTRLQKYVVTYEYTSSRSAAMAGTTLKIDRKFVAKKLGFNNVSTNSMDAVSDRDFVLDFAYANSMIMMHMSRICEEIVLWMNPQFDLIDVDRILHRVIDNATKKKNPDVAELIRGKNRKCLWKLSFTSYLTQVVYHSHTIEIYKRIKSKYLIQ